MDLRKQIAKALKDLGVTETAKRLGLSTETTLRLAAGVRVHAGTEALATQNLERLAAGGG